MPNALMIGIGGTGIKTLLHIKQQLTDKSPDHRLPMNVKLIGIDTTDVPEVITGVDACLDNNEFVNLVGDLYPQTCVSGVNSKNWFKKDWYCNHPNAHTLLYSGNGAGMHRQIGRLILHEMLTAGQASPLYTRLHEKLESLANDLIYVLVFGSLAGGSGASMVVDIPFLVRAIGSNIQGVHIDPFGFFALPRAFAHTQGVPFDDNMRARAVAALRELYRFNMINDASIGYNFNYVPGDNVLSFRSSGTPYSLIYLFDERDNQPNNALPTNPLNLPIEHGVCATMSSYAWMFADDTANNLAAAIANRTLELGNCATDYNGYTPPFCASFGSFSYVLPIGKLVDSWRFRFGQELVDSLLPLDSQGEIHPGRRNGVDGTAGSADMANVIRVDLNKIKEVVNDIIETGGAMATRNMDTEFPNYVTPLYNRTVNDWQTQLINPDPTEEQSTTLEDMRKCHYCRIKPGVLGKIDVDEESMVSIENIRDHGNSALETARALKNQCDLKWKEKRIVWEEVIRQRILVQVQEFREWFDDFIEITLNGNLPDEAQNALQNRTGKLGWLWDFMKEYKASLDGTTNTLKVCIQSYQKEIDNKQFLITTTGKSQQTLWEELAKKPSTGNQKKYLEIRQEILELEKRKMLASGELSILTEMKVLTESLLSELEGFIRLMRSEDRTNLFSALRDCQDRIDRDRRDARELSKVREYVYDPVWEGIKYTGFLQANQMGITPYQEVLKDIHWQVGNKTITIDKQNRQVPALSIQVDGFALEQSGPLRVNKISPFAANENDQGKREKVAGAADRLAARCKPIFDRVWDRDAAGNHKFSVLNYLADTWSDAPPRSPQDFAHGVAEMVGPLLKGVTVQQSAKRLVYILAPATQEPTALNWQTLMGNALRTTLGENTNNISPTWWHDDPTTFTAIIYTDLVDFTKIDSYRHGKAPYTDLNPVFLPAPRLSRPLLHVFPADQNASRYDEPDAQGGLLDAKIVGLFEHEDRLQLFLSGLIWGFIRREFVDSGTGTNASVFILRLPPKEAEQDRNHQLVTQDYIVYLNNKKYTRGLLASVLEAAETFCLRKTAYNEQENGSSLQTLRDFRLRLAQQVDAKVAEKALENETLWKTGARGSIEARIINLPIDSQIRKDLIKTNTRLLVVRDWCRAKGNLGVPEINQIFNQFDKAREQFDPHKTLETFKESEKQFVYQVLDQMLFDQFNELIANINAQLP